MHGAHKKFQKIPLKIPRMHAARLRAGLRTSDTSVIGAVDYLLNIAVAEGNLENAMEIIICALNTEHVRADHFEAEATRLGKELRDLQLPKGG